VTRLVTWTTPIAVGAVSVDWQAADAIGWAPESLEREAPDGASYAEVPAPALKAKNYDAWAKQFTTAVLAREAMELLRSPSAGEVSRPGETERDFRARLQQASRESRDRALDALRRKYAPRLAMLEEKLRRAQQTVERESQQASGQKVQTMISVGATLLGALMGRKAISASTVGRATTAARGLGRSAKESEDIDRAKDTVRAVEEQRQSLEDDLKTETATLEAAHDPATEMFERISVKPKRTNVSVKIVALVWQ
jgi:hypothetical protein